jgi:hypothetical protein
VDDIQRHDYILAQCKTDDRAAYSWGTVRQNRREAGVADFLSHSNVDYSLCERSIGLAFEESTNEDNGNQLPVCVSKCLWIGWSAPIEERHADLTKYSEAR